MGRTALISVCLPVFLLACGGSSNGQEDPGGRSDPELTKAVEELLPQLERASGLKAVRAPEARRASRVTLERYLVDRLESEYPGDTLHNMTLAYRAFGLLPDTVDLRTLLVDLLLEQAVGFYDPAREVLFVREEVTATELKGVLAHELVHALQDQHVDLDSLIRGRATNDGESAAQAAVEGQATVAMLLYQLSEAVGRPVGVTELPELGPEMAALAVDPGLMPELTRAPAIIRETLLFPYFTGGRFVQRLWRSRHGQPSPLSLWLPESTEQLLHTERLLGQRDRPSALQLPSPAAGWRTLYARDLGELEIQIYFEEHLADPGAAARAASGWDADAFALLERDGQQALVWYTVWDTPGDAEEFVQAYRRAFRARFGGSVDAGELRGAGRAGRVERIESSSAPVVRVVETPADVEVVLDPRLRLEFRR